MTDPVITGLLFNYFDATFASTTTPAAIAYVRVSVTRQSRAFNNATRQYNTKTLQTEVRMRTR